MVVEILGGRDWSIGSEPFIFQIISIGQKLMNAKFRKKKSGFKELSEPIADQSTNKTSTLSNNNPQISKTKTKNKAIPNRVNEAKLRLPD